MDDRVKSRMDAKVYGFNDLENAIQKYRASGQELSELLKNVGDLWVAYKDEPVLPE